MGLDIDFEKRGVKISLYGSLILTLTAALMAVMAQSQAILLDGAYTLITLALAYISLRVIELLEIPEASDRPFGFMAMEPLLNIGKSLVILIVLAVFLVTNLKDLLSGGRATNLDLTVLYTLACLVVYAFTIHLLNRCKRRVNSSILNLESRNWRIDAAMTAGIAISLLVAYLLVRLGNTAILPYIDPGMVVILAVLSITPVSQDLIREVRNLLLLSPENKIETQVLDQLAPVAAAHGIRGMKAWGLKSGRVLYLFLYCKLENDHTSITALDQIRTAIFQQLGKFHDRFWADIMFTEWDPNASFEHQPAATARLEQRGTAR